MKEQKTTSGQDHSRELGMFSLEKRSLGINLRALLKSLMRDDTEYVCDSARETGSFRKKDLFSKKSFRPKLRANFLIVLTLMK